MARYKPAGTRKSTGTRSSRGIIPCSILILAIFALVFLLFYEMLKSGR